METNSKNSTAAIINLSTLSQYFIPFGNFIFPIIIWSAKKDSSEYVNRQGKETINFQLSLFLYSLILALIAIPIFLITIFRNVDLNAFLSNHDDLIFENLNIADHAGLFTVGIMTIVVFGFMKVAEFFLIIYASVKTSSGADYKYPLTIPFIK